MASRRLRKRRSLRSNDVRDWTYLLPIFFALPLTYVAWRVHQALFLSDVHARLVSEALIFLQHGRFQSVHFIFPSLPLFITAFTPSPWMLSLYAALAGGVTFWMIWRHLHRTNCSTLLKITLLFAFATIPPVVFLFTQSITDAIALMLFALAWRAFLRFFLQHITWAGFASGLLLGLAFFFNLNAFLWGIMFGFSVFGVVHFSRQVPQNQERGASYAMAMIIAFPVVYIFLSWCYVSWLSYGHPLQFLDAAIIPAHGFLSSHNDAVYTFPDALRITLDDFFRQPLTFATFILLVLSSSVWLAVPLAAISGIALFRGFGLVIYTEAMAIGTFAVLALIALPISLQKHWRAFLLSSAIIQIALAPFLPIRTAEIHEWREVLITGTPRQTDVLDQLAAESMANAPAFRILADDRSAYRLIARAGTARPFLLPGDATYTEAMISPILFVDYILVADDPSPLDNLSRLYASDPPGGFVLSSHWQGWRLYRRVGIPAILPEELLVNPQDLDIESINGG